MNVRRLSGPEPIALPSDVPGGHGAADPVVAAYIAAVQASVDGPTGWLGRSLGAQTLELTMGKFRRSMRLPYEPVTEIDAITYRDAEGVVQTVDEASYRLVSGNQLQFKTEFNFPAIDCVADAVKITYSAGYADGGVPPNAKQAVIIGVQQIKAMSEQSLFLRSETVEGVGATSYTFSEAAHELVKRVTDALLQPLKLHWL